MFIPILLFATAVTTPSSSSGVITIANGGGATLCDSPEGSLVKECAPGYCRTLLIATDPPIPERWCRDGRVEDWNEAKQAWVPWGPQGRAYGPPKEVKP